MKLLIITAIVAFEKEIKIMLKKANIITYSFQDVKGYSDISEETIDSNWFAAEYNETESLLFYAFARAEEVDRVFNLINTFNAKEETLSQIHVAVVNIEKSNNARLHIV
jgi:hypothetical protein